jgi:hypothetical protein
MKKRVCIVGMMFGFLMLLGLWPFVASADTLRKKETLHPTMIDEKPKIDGVLDEEIWQTKPLERPFSTYYPHIGEPSPYKTLVWMAYDKENLYFAFMCEDPEPNKIKTSIAKRDTIFFDDWVGLSLDPFGNGQTAWALFVNPSGIQADMLCSGSGLEDGAPDMVWESAAKITDKGYQVEIGLPLRSFAFKSGKEVEMGILFWRNINRHAVRACWPEYLPGGKVFGTQTPIIYKNLKSPLKLELLPNIVYGSHQDRVSPDQWGSRDVFKGIGLGVKYGLTSSITADITINPDFSQVESDAFQVEVNQRYPLFYTEKRPFFMEGSDAFSFFVVPGLYYFDTYFQTPVHTRRILDPAWGIKLSGSVGKTTFGILTAGDQQPGQSWLVGVNPNEGKQAFWGIARGKFSLGRDNYIGALYSGREFAGEYNRVFGADFLFRPFRYHLVSGSFLRSTSSPGSSSSNSGSLDDSNYNLMYWVMTKNYRVIAALEHFGTDFRMDSAFIRRTGINHYVLHAMFNFLPKWKKFNWLKRISSINNFALIHDLATGKDDYSINLSLDGRFFKEAFCGIRYFNRREYWKGLQFDQILWIAYGRIQLTKWLRIEGEYHFGDKIYYEGEPPFLGRGTNLFLFLHIQPSEKFNQLFIIQHADLEKDNVKPYDVDIIFSRTTYQFNKNLFLRAMIQYNSFQKLMLTDFLVSFTLVPGTVLHVGYGGIYENRRWQDNNWLYRQGDMLNLRRSFFAKISYLYRF